MKLLEILHSLSGERKKGLINIDDWKFEHVAHLKDMGFDFDGDFTLSLESPKIKITKKNTPQGDLFILEDEDKGIYQFRKFDDIVNFFDNYHQKEFDQSTE